MTARLQKYVYIFLAFTLLMVSRHEGKAQHAYGTSPGRQDALQYLTDNEKEVLTLLNMVRTNGAAFAHSYLDMLVEAEGDIELLALRERLINLPALPPLQPITGLQKAAFIQARHLAQSTTASTTAYEQPFYDRIHQYLPGVGRVGESYHKGSNDPLLIVVQVLLGNEEVEKGNIAVLDPDLRWIGISIQPDIDECYSTVMDLAGQPHNQFAGNSASRPGKVSSNYTEKCPPGVMIKRRTTLGKLMKKIF